MKIFVGEATVQQTAFAVVLNVLICICAMGTIHQVSCNANRTAAVSKLVESFGFPEDDSVIMTELPKSTPTNVTEKSVTIQTNKSVTAAASNSTSNSTKTVRTCACEDSEESLICASNGITYKSSCRFECAKARVKRLRQVKEGRCSQAAGAQSYWQANKSG